MFCIPDVYSYASRVELKHDGNNTVLEVKQCTFWTLVIETALFVDNAWLCLQSDHGAAHPGSRFFFERDAYNNETVLFTKFFALYGSSVLPDRLRATLQFSGHRNTHSGHCTTASRKLR